MSATSAALCARAHEAMTMQRGPTPPPPAANGLTAREQEVLQGLGAGLSNKAIARRLGIADGTVKTHVKAILRALGAPNRTAAVVLANRAGWLRP